MNCKFLLYFCRFIFVGKCCAVDYISDQALNRTACSTVNVVSSDAIQLPHSMLNKTYNIPTDFRNELSSCSTGKCCNTSIYEAKNVRTGHTDTTRSDQPTDQPSSSVPNNTKIIFFFYYLKCVLINKKYISHEGSNEIHQTKDKPEN